MKFYDHLSIKEKETIIKLLLCTIIAFLFSWAIGEPYSPTTAITANLFLYTDRGYFGGLRYGARRVLVQIVQGIFSMGVIAIFKFWLHVDMPDIILIIIASCVALAIGLPLNFKYTYAPVVCTLANASYVIVCTTVKDISTFPYRILECVAGLLIGYIINYFIMPQSDRYNDALKKVKECVTSLIKNDINAKYKNNKIMLKKDISYIYEDNEKGIKKHRRTEKQLKTISLYENIVNDMENCILVLNNSSEVISKEVLETSKQIFDVCTYYLCKEIGIDGFYKDNLELIDKLQLKVKNHEEILFCAPIIKYNNDIKLLKDIN